MIYIFYSIFYLTLYLKHDDKFASPLQNTMSFPCLASYDLFLNIINKIIHTQLTQIPTYTDTVLNLTKSTDNEPQSKSTTFLSALSPPNFPYNYFPTNTLYLLDYLYLSLLHYFRSLLLFSKSFCLQSSAKLTSFSYVRAKSTLSDKNRNRLNI